MTRVLGPGTQLKSSQKLHYCTVRCSRLRKKEEVLRANNWKEALRVKECSRGFPLLASWKEAVRGNECRWGLSLPANWKEELRGNERGLVLPLLDSWKEARLVSECSWGLLLLDSWKEAYHVDNESGHV